MSENNSSSAEAQAYFSARFQEDRGRAKVWRAITEYLSARWIGPSAAVLELGVGYGDFLRQVAATRKAGIDLNGDYGSRLQGVDFQAQSVLEEWPQWQPFDVVFASNFLEHFADTELETIVTRVKAHLKPGGRFICLQPNFRHAYKQYWDDYTHKKAFTHVSLADFLTAQGLEVEQVKPRFLPLTLKSLLPKSYWLTKLYLMMPFKPLSGQMLVVAKNKDHV